MRSRLDPSHPHYNPDPHAHPGLHVIALIEAIKGLLAVIAASGLAILGPAPLQRWVHLLIARFQLDPEHGALALFASRISPVAVHWAAFAVVAYGVLHIVEAWGLWRAKVWASWLGCLAAALYLPLDLFAMWKHPGIAAVIVLSINVIVVWVLARDIARRRY
jgi:uncharacterized membrane protein (DUF2068 family)